MHGGVKFEIRSLVHRMHNGHPIGNCSCKESFPGAAHRVWIVANVETLNVKLSHEDVRLGVVAVPRELECPSAVPATVSFVLPPGPIIARRRGTAGVLRQFNLVRELETCFGYDGDHEAFAPLVVLVINRKSR